MGKACSEKVSAVCMRNQRTKREAAVEREGKPDKNDEMGTQGHPRVPPSLGIT